MRTASLEARQPCPRSDDKACRELVERVTRGVQEVLKAVSSPAAPRVGFRVGTPSQPQAPQHLHLAWCFPTATRRGTQQGAKDDGLLLRHKRRTEFETAASVRANTRRPLNALERASFTASVAAPRYRLRADAEGGRGVGCSCSAEASAALKPAVWLSGVLGAGSGGGWPLWGVALHSQPGSRLALQGRFLSDTSACQQLLLQADVRVRSRGRLVGHLALAQEEGAREVGVEVGCRFAVRRRAAERGAAGGAALLQEALPGLGAAAAGNGGGGTVGGEQGSIGAVLRVPGAEQAPSVMLQWSVQAGMA